jgi:ABC-type glycerol-3-phosphate transport system substrate-binding protein
MQMRLWIAAALLVLLTTAACGASTATPAAEATPSAGFATVTPAAADAATAATPLPTVDPTAVAEALAANVATAMESVQRPEGDVAATVNGEDIPTERYLEFLTLRLNTVTSQYGLDWADEGNLVILRQIESQVLERW